MHIVTDPSTVTRTLRALATGLRTDWYSWRDWYLLTLTAKPALHGHGHDRMAQGLRALLEGHDGVILSCQNGTCVGVFHHKYRLNLIELEEMIQQSIEKPHGTKLQLHLLAVADGAEEALLHINHFIDPRLAIDDEQTTEEPELDFSTSVHRFRELVELWERSRNGSRKRTKPHVMLVDDDACTRGIISHTLKQDYAMLTAENCAEEIRKQILFAPDIVFLDIGLPDHSGLELLHYIRAHDPLCRVIMFSGNGYLKNRLTAFAHGASGFIAKPFNRQSFKRYIDAWHAPQLIKDMAVGV